MRHFGTLFNINYVNRGLALLESLRLHEKNFRLYVLCLDDLTHEYFLKNEPNEVVPIALSDIEIMFPNLRQAKTNRSLVEYFFTLSPALPLYLLRKFNLPQITTLDSDIFIYSSLNPVFEEMGENSILISPHRFAPGLKHKEVYGLYNVSFQSFKNDNIGISCLEEWLKNCTDWCFDKLENGKFADQLYLDSWIEKYKNVWVISHQGAAVAPWNLSGSELKMKEGVLFVNDVPLLFYHFHGVKFLTESLVLHNLNEYDVKLTDLVVKHLYGPYLIKLARYSAATDVSHSNLRYNYSKMWILKRILKGGALRIKGDKAEHMNKHLQGFFNGLSNLFSK